MKKFNMFTAAVFAVLASGCASDLPPQAEEIFMTDGMP